MVQFKKIFAGIISAVVMIAAVGVSADADAIGYWTPGGSGGKMYAILMTEKDYLTPQTNGFYAYKYGVTAYYDYYGAIANHWDVTAVFNTRTNSKTVTAEMNNTRMCYAFSTVAESAPQYVSGNHKAVATSTAYGNVTINLNVAY